MVELAGRGGLIHYAFQLARALSARGIEVALITDRDYELEALPHPFEVRPLLRLWDPKPARPPRGGVAGLPRRAARAVRHYREWLRLVRHLRRDRPDVVLLGDIRFPTDLVALIALRRAGLRLADVCHNVHPFGRSGTGSGMPRTSAWMRRAFERVYRRFDVIFVHYESNRRAFLDAFGTPAERIVAIPHGDESLFRELRDPGVDAAALRRSLDLPSQAPVVLLFGSLSRYKGADLLIEAFARVRREQPLAHLVLAGFPEPDFDAAAHRRLADRLGVAAAVVAAWMELATVAALPYRAGYHSGVLHLAQTFAVPVVASRVGSLPEVVRDGENGLLVPPGDAAALARALSQLLGDAAAARRMGDAARGDAESRFGWARVAAIVAERLEAAVSGEVA